LLALLRAQPYSPRYQGKGFTNFSLHVCISGNFRSTWVAFFFSQLTLSTLLPHDTKSNMWIVFLDISVGSAITPLFIHVLIFTAHSYFGGGLSVGRVCYVPMRFSYHGLTALSGPGPPFYRGFTITLRHTTLGKTSLDERSVRRRDVYLQVTTVTLNHFVHKVSLYFPTPAVNWRLLEW